MGVVGGGLSGLSGLLGLRFPPDFGDLGGALFGATGRGFVAMEGVASDLLAEDFELGKHFLNSIVGGGTGIGSLVSNNEGFGGSGGDDGVSVITDDDGMEDPSLSAV